jgi:hypothetical protein
MPTVSTQTRIPPFAGLTDGIIARVPRGSRFAFLMTMFRDVDDRPYLQMVAHQREADKRRTATAAGAGVRD